MSSLDKVFSTLKTGRGRGNWDHAGIPGHQGGSQPQQIQGIIEKIKDSVAPEIKIWEEKAFSHIKKLEKYCKEDVYSEAKGTTEVHKLKVKAGWNKSIEKFFGYKPDDLRKILHKEAEHKLSKIDVAVLKKLEGVEVNKVELLNFNANSKNSFVEGSWKINGDKVFSFRTIYAGGYNIQELHIRTIYQYK